MFIKNHKSEDVARAVASFNVFLARQRTAAAVSDDPICKEERTHEYIGR